MVFLCEAASLTHHSLSCCFPPLLPYFRRCCLCILQDTAVLWKAAKYLAGESWQWCGSSKWWLRQRTWDYQDAMETKWNWLQGFLSRKNFTEREVFNQQQQLVHSAVQWALFKAAIYELICKAWCQLSAPPLMSFGRKEWGQEQKAGHCRTVHGDGEGLLGAASLFYLCSEPCCWGSGVGNLRTLVQNRTAMPGGELSQCRGRSAPLLQTAVLYFWTRSPFAQHCPLRLC